MKVRYNFHLSLLCYVLIGHPLPPSLHISLPKYVNWLTSTTGCPFRIIALGRGCLDEFTILMDLLFPFLILSPKEAASFSSE